jgi:hypothetical protein
VLRFGNWLEVGNDLFMHLIASADIRYVTAHNLDFERRIRDQTVSRSPTNTAQHDTEGDLQAVFDGNLIDDRNNSTNPGGTDVFGRGASTENSNLRVERYWIRYKFPNTPVALFVGADLLATSQAGILGNDDPRLQIEAEFGNLQVWAAAIVERESQRLGLQNDNDAITYVFGGTYDLRPHRFGLDVVYFRDRFQGADTLADTADGFRGQKTDSVWLNASWSGQVGPVRALVQGNLVTGAARGGTAVLSLEGLPIGIPAGRDYTILAGAVIAYAEVDFGLVFPFVGFIFGSGDGDPRDDELHGFQAQPINDSTQITGTPFFPHLDKSSAFALRDYSCPARVRGLPARVPVGNPYAIGTVVLGGASGGPGRGFAECAHSTSNVFNSRLGEYSHLGLWTTYSNPGTLVIPVGLRVFALKEHEFTGWYVYRAMVDSTLLEVAFAPELAGRRIGKSIYHEVGGFWQWSVNPHFDIRRDCVGAGP